MFTKTAPSLLKAKCVACKLFPRLSETTDGPVSLSAGRLSNVFLRKTPFQKAINFHTKFSRSGSPSHLPLKFPRVHFHFCTVRGTYRWGSTMPPSGRAAQLAGAPSQMKLYTYITRASQRHCSTPDRPLAQLLYAYIVGLHICGPRWSTSLHLGSEKHWTSDSWAPGFLHTPALAARVPAGFLHHCKDQQTKIFCTSFSREQIHPPRRP